MTLTAITACLKVLLLAATFLLTSGITTVVQSVFITHVEYVD